MLMYAYASMLIRRLAHSSCLHCLLLWLQFAPQHSVDYVYDCGCYHCTSIFYIIIIMIMTITVYNNHVIPAKVALLAIQA